MDSLKNKNWFKYDENKARARQMIAPFDNIWIGTDPTDGMTLETAQSFDAIVNVSCTECANFYPSRPDQRMYWVPINEIGDYSHGSFFYIKKVLDFHHKTKDKILIHCHAGAQRSPAHFIWWLVSLGHTVEEAVCIELGSRRTPEGIKEMKDSGLYDYRIYNDRRQGNIPWTLPEMYKRMNENPSYGLASALLGGGDIDDSIETTCQGHKDRRKKYNRLKYYYKLKYWFSNTKRRFKIWMDGKVVVQHTEGLSEVCKKEDVEKVIAKHKAIPSYESRKKEENEALQKMWNDFDNTYISCKLCDKPIKGKRLKIKGDRYICYKCQSDYAQSCKETMLGTTTMT